MLQGEIKCSHKGGVPSVFIHIQGRDGYAHVKNKMVRLYICIQYHHIYFGLYGFNLHVYVFDVYMIKKVKEIEPDEEWYTVVERKGKQRRRISR